MSLKYQVTRTKVHLYYTRHGEYHRVLEPALIAQSSGYLYWMEYNLLHRLNGPADICIDGRRWYFIRGINIKREEYDAKVRSYFI